MKNNIILINANVIKPQIQNEIHLKLLKCHLTCNKTKKCKYHMLFIKANRYKNGPLGMALSEPFRKPNLSYRFLALLECHVNHV